MRELRSIVYTIAVVLVWTICSGTQKTYAQGIDSTTVVKYLPLFSGDSVKVEYVYSKRDLSPFVVLLPDRYGVQVSTRQLLHVYASAGYHACVIHLRSFADLTDPAHNVKYDSTDIDRVIEAVIDVRNDTRGFQKAALLGFDIGATIGLRAENRIPLFYAISVFYPLEALELLRSLSNSKARIGVNVGINDEAYSDETRMSIEKIGEKYEHIRVQYYDADEFFFNPGHPNYNKGEMQRAVNDVAGFFNKLLQLQRTENE